MRPTATARFKPTLKQALKIMVYAVLKRDMKIVVKEADIIHNTTGDSANAD